MRSVHMNQAVSVGKKQQRDEIKLTSAPSMVRGARNEMNYGPAPLIDFAKHAADLWHNAAFDGRGFDREPARPPVFGGT